MKATYNIPLFNVLSKLPLKNCSLLSLGCGTALLEQKLEKKYSCKITGIDINDAIKETKINKKYQIDIEKENIVCVLKEKFDIILCADILEHLHSPDDLLQKCKILLKKNGFIIASIPNIANWSIRFQLLLGNFNYTEYGILDKTHLHFYTYATAKNLISKYFIIKKIYYSTSLINIFSKKIRKNINIQQKILKKDIEIKQKNRIIKILCEKIDRFLTSLFPNLFAYQFIIIAKLK